MKAILILCLADVSIAAVVFVGLKLVRATRLWPAALLIVTAPLEVYRSSSSAGANLSLFRIALAIAIAALAVERVRGNKRFPRGLAVAFAIYAALVAWQLISLAFVTGNHTFAYRLVGQYAAGIVAALVITCYVERRDLRIAAALCGGGAVLPLLAAAFRVFSVRNGGSGDLPGLSELPLNLTIEGARQTGSTLLNGTQRLNATFSDPNLFGYYIATVFLVLAGAVSSALLIERPVRWRVVSSYLLLMLSSAIAIIGTYSRSAWVLAVVGVIVLVALLGRAFWTRRRTITACVIGAVALGLASPLIAARLGASEPGNGKSTQVHAHTMSLALKLATRHPLTGVGLGGYGPYAGQPPLISSAVSTFLTIAAELGILGLALLVAAIAVTSIAAIKSVRRSPPADRALLAGFIAAFVGLAAANTIGEIWKDDFQWVLFGLLLALTTQPHLALRVAPFQKRLGVASSETPLDGPEQNQVAV